MTKRVFLALFLSILGSLSCFGASIGLNSFSGLDTQDPPNALQPSQSQDLLNVRIQPGGRSVFKRDGYGLFASLNSISTATVHGGYHFQQTGGSDVQLWGSDTGLFASVNDTAFVKVATGTVGATWQCTDNLGFAYCVTSSGIDTPVKTDGSVANTTYVGAIPTGTIIASTPLQLIVAGVAGNLSTIYVSANNNFSNFTTGPLPTDSYTEIINAPGSRITHLGYYFGNIYWWKDQSLGYVSGSGSQGTVGITIISNQIGTLDNSSAFWNPTTYDVGNKFNSGAQTTTSGNPYFNEMSSLGGVFFRGQDNHIYQYDGYTLTRLSRIITPNVTASSRRKSNSWIQTTQSDFNGGSYTTATYNSSFGGVIISTNNFNTPDNSFENHNWTQSGGWGFRLNNLPGDHCTINAKDGSYFEYYQRDIASTQTVTISLIDSGSNVLTSTSIPWINNSCTFQQGTLQSAPSSAKTIAQIKMVSTSDNGNGFVISPSFTYNGNAITFWYATDSNTNKTEAFDFFQNGQSTTTGTGYYFSAVNNATNLTSWGNFTTTNVTNGGTHTFYTRSSTNSFTALSSTPAWTAQTNNSLVAASTGTYFQMADTFTVTTSSQNPVLQSFTFNWFEGTAGDKAYINYFQDAILFSVSSGSSTSTNNTIFYLDLLNNTWLKDNIASNGFAVENNALYIGDPLSANIYKFGGVTTDNGNSIHAYWKSMDFTGQDPTVQNSFDQADFAFAEASTTVSYVYTIDQSSSTSMPISLYSATHSILKRGFALIPGRIGTFYNFKIDDNTSLPAWTLMGQRTTYSPLPWRPQTAQ